MTCAGHNFYKWFCLTLSSGQSCKQCQVRQSPGSECEIKLCTTESQGMHLTIADLRPLTGTLEIFLHTITNTEHVASSLSRDKIMLSSVHLSPAPKSCYPGVASHFNFEAVTSERRNMTLPASQCHLVLSRARNWKTVPAGFCWWLWLVICEASAQERRLRRQWLSSSCLLFLLLVCYIYCQRCR